MPQIARATPVLTNPDQSLQLDEFYIDKQAGRRKATPHTAVCGWFSGDRTVQAPNREIRPKNLRHRE